MPLANIQPEDYYTNEELHGNYQYVTLEDIVNNFIMSGQDDDYTSNVDRYKVLYQARRGFRELYFDAVGEVKPIALELSPQLTVTLPQDYVNYVRISWLDSEGGLHAMALDNTLSIAKEYLQDNEYGLLFDSEGDILEGSPVPNTKNNSITLNQRGFNPNVDLSKSYKNGSYNIDKSNGLIKFGSEVFGKTVVLEYISDGVFTNAEGSTDLKIHKFAETAVYDWMYWQLIMRRIHVPANEKSRARKEWFNSRRLSIRRINAIKSEDLRQVFKSGTKWIKGV
jgi:hypothetical protein